MAPPDALATTPGDGKTQAVEASVAKSMPRSRHLSYLHLQAGKRVGLRLLAIAKWSHEPQFWSRGGHGSESPNSVSNFSTASAECCIPARGPGCGPAPGLAVS